VSPLSEFQIKFHTYFANSNLFADQLQFQEIKQVVDLTKANVEATLAQASGYDLKDHQDFNEKFFKFVTMSSLLSHLPVVRMYTTSTSYITRRELIY